MKKRIMKAAFVVTIAGSLITSGIQTAAANSGNLGDLQSKKASVQAKADEKQSEITKLDGELKDIEAKIESVRAEELATEKKLAKTEEEMKKLEEEIDQLKEEIKIVEARIEERKGLIEERAIEAYQSGGDASYLEVLLGAQDFGDFVTQATAMTTIAEHDREILDEHIADEEKLQEMKAEVEEKKAEVKAQKEELESLKEELASKKEELDKLSDDLKQKKQQLEDELGEIMSEEEVLKKQEAALKVEKKKQAAPSVSASSGSTGGSKGSSSGGSSSNGGGSSAPKASSAGFINPAPGVGVYSGYGTRNGRPHNGVDLSSRGHVPIVAAQSGTVATSGYRSDYGHWITITHNINGQQITTLYAHLKSRSVSAGESVSQGQQIGVMGSTGDSSGQHLHFEVHEGPFRFGDSAVDPMKYLP